MMNTIAAHNLKMRQVEMSLRIVKLMTDGDTVTQDGVSVTKVGRFYHVTDGAHTMSRLGLEQAAAIFCFGF
jgi:hypothetical protein